MALKDSLDNYFDLILLVTILRIPLVILHDITYTSSSSRLPGQQAFAKRSNYIATKSEDNIFVTYYFVKFNWQQDICLASPIIREEAFT